MSMRSYSFIDDIVKLVLNRYSSTLQATLFFCPFARTGCVVFVYLCSALVFPLLDPGQYMCVPPLNPCSGGGIDRELHFDPSQPQE